VEQDDRRRETRIRAQGQVVLVTADERSIPATVCDISTFGMRVETSEELAPGLPLRVEVHGFGARGEVRYCARKDGKFQVGLNLDSPRIGLNPDFDAATDQEPGGKR
jgi:hypothetical protein